MMTTMTEEPGWRKDSTKRPNNEDIFLWLLFIVFGSNQIASHLVSFCLAH